MSEIEIVLALLVGVVGLSLLARRIGQPYPIVLVLGGLALALLPGVPTVALQPDLVFLLFLPPLLYAQAWRTSWRDFRANLRPIGLLAIGLVLVTTVAVAVVAHAAIPGMPWAVAFTLGAIVSPTDALAATTIAARMNVPRRVSTILSGESLVNDASGLVTYRFAVAAVTTGAFSLAAAAGQFAVSSIGGLALGIAVGWLANRVESWLDDPPVEVVISFLIPFAAYIPADRLGVSGVLAAVAAGLLTGQRAPRTLSARSRLQAVAVWETLDFVLNGLLFLLIGLQLRTVLRTPGTAGASALLGQAALVCAVVVAVRVAWVFGTAYIPRLVSAALRERDPSPPWQYPAIVAWAGLRGGVSLAAALALPLTVADGGAFPFRDVVLLVTFAVILATLVGQGLSLPAVVRAVGVERDDAPAAEEVIARKAMARAGMTRLEETARRLSRTARATYRDVAPDLERLRRAHRRRVRLASAAKHVRTTPQGDAEYRPGDPGATEEAREIAREARRAETLRDVERDVVDAERDAIIALRDAGTIGDEALREAERELDLREERLLTREATAESLGVRGREGDDAQDEAAGEGAGG